MTSFPPSFLTHLLLAAPSAYLQKNKPCYADDCRLREDART